MADKSHEVRLHCYVQHTQHNLLFVQLLDVLAPDGDHTGKAKTRFEIHRDGDW